ncbi:nodulin-like protein, partial [Genlisea aurea]
GFLGLSGAVLIQVYEALFPGKPSSFLLMLAIVPTLLSLSLMFLVKIQHHSHPHSLHDQNYINGFSLISIALASYVMLLILSSKLFVLSQWIHSISLLPLLILLCSPLGVAVKSGLRETPDSAPLLVADDETDCDLQQMDLLQALRSLDFWLLFAAMLCGMGSGLATIDNLAQVGESLNYSPTQCSTLVSLWSVWNFAGRFGSGYLSDASARRYGLERPALMVASLAAMGGGHFVIGSGLPGNLYVGSVVVGLCYGSQWSLMPTVASEVFGVRHFGTIFNAVAAASPLGSYVWSVRVIGYLYDREGGGVPGGCRGVRCFRSAFFILGCVAVLGSFVAVVLLLRTRGIYGTIMMRSRRRRSMLA